MNMTYHLTYSNAVSKSCFYGTQHRCPVCNSNTSKKLIKAFSPNRKIEVSQKFHVITKGSNLTDIADRCYASERWSHREL